MFAPITVDGDVAAGLIPSLLAKGNSSAKEDQKFIISLEEGNTLCVQKRETKAYIRVLNMQRVKIDDIQTRQKYRQARSLAADYYFGMIPRPLELEKMIDNIYPNSQARRKYFYWLATLGLPAGLPYRDYETLIEKGGDSLRRMLLNNSSWQHFPSTLKTTEISKSLEQIVTTGTEMFVPLSHTVLMAEKIGECLTMFLSVRGKYEEIRLKVS